MSPFRLTGRAAPAEGAVDVVLSLRSPGGDIPVTKAELREATATIGGEPSTIEVVDFTPKLSGCSMTLRIPGEGPVALTGHLDLINPDGSRWGTVPLPETLE